MLELAEAVRPRQESDLSELLDAADYIDNDVVDSASDPLDGEEVRTIAGRSLVTSRDGILTAKS